MSAGIDSGSVPTQASAGGQVGGGDVLASGAHGQRTLSWAAVTELVTFLLPALPLWRCSWRCSSAATPAARRSSASPSGSRRRLDRRGAASAPSADPARLRPPSLVARRRTPPRPLAFRPRSARSRPQRRAQAAVGEDDACPMPYATRAARGDLEDEGREARVPCCWRLAAAGALAACGGSDSGTTETGGEESAPVSGQFAACRRRAGRLGSRPAKPNWRAADGGTTVSISVTGLEPKTEYIAHLHTGGCDRADPGGTALPVRAGRLRGAAERDPPRVHLRTPPVKAKRKPPASARSPVGEAGSVVAPHRRARSFEMPANTARACGTAVAAAMASLLVHEGDATATQAQRKAKDRLRRTRRPPRARRSGTKVGSDSRRRRRADDRGPRRRTGRRHPDARIQRRRRGPLPGLLRHGRRDPRPRLRHR